MLTKNTSQKPSAIETKALLVLLAGSALRIGEALALGRGNVWDPEAGTVTVSGTLVNGEFQPAPKTKAGKRVVDLPPTVNALLKSLYPDEAARKGILFPQSEDTYRLRFQSLGIHGFHSLRRYRITFLQLANTPDSLIKFWAGHAGKDITARYTKVGSEIAARKNWAGQTGVEFL